MQPFSLLEDLRRHMSEAVIAQSGFRDLILREILRKNLVSASGKASLIPHPTLEGAFPFVASDRNLQQFQDALLHENTIAALAGDNSGEGYSFPLDRMPYRHQDEAWQVLTNPNIKSTVISAGTGSGKTECFLVPLLDALYRQNASSSGVEALIIYPLNALIASQQERLDVWTKPAKGKIRYCLYKGDLPEKLPASKLQHLKINDPQNVADRDSLRAQPPQILITNITMLEYMLLRPDDKPIIEASKGKLKWIILDEAHTLIGSAAAEIALLLRRVMQAFEVEPENVRFVATSATIGEGEKSKLELQQFLANLAGIDTSQVEVIFGERQLPHRPGKNGALPNRAQMNELSPSELYKRLGSCNEIWALIEKLKTSPISTAEFGQIARKYDMTGDELAMALTKAQHVNQETKQQETLAPLRVHSFHRAISGLWTCTNPTCCGKENEKWPAGKIFYERLEECDACHMPVAEITGCSDCGELCLLADEFQDGSLCPPLIEPVEDEFSFDALKENQANDDENEDVINRIEDEDHSSVKVPRCFTFNHPIYKSRYVDLATGKTLDSETENCYSLKFAPYFTRSKCPHCEAESKTGDKIYPFRFGAPFIITNAAPILLAEMPAKKDVDEPHLPQTPPEIPASGKQLISFTDSRQGTARISAKLQIDSERAFIRSFIYQNVQFENLNTTKNGDIEEKIIQIEALKAIPDWQQNPTFSGMIEKIQREIEAIGSAGKNISWQDLTTRLADRIELRDWLPDVWGARSDIFSKNDNRNPARQMAEFLLLRELSRRPKAANSMETFGMARLVYPAIENLKKPPAIFLNHNKTLQDWKDWLTALVTLSIRNNLAVNIPRDIFKWITPKGFPKTIATPHKAPEKGEIAWPMAKNDRTIAVRLLYLGLGLNKNSAIDRDDIDKCLAEAWKCLNPIIPQGADGRSALDFSKLEIGALSHGYLCPITNRIWDVAPFGLSPYAQLSSQTVKKLDFPAFPVNEDRDTRKEFIKTDEKIINLRSLGIWTDLQDKIALFSPYTRSAEHSAQISPQTLRHYEKLFKQGEINYLNCSTTMEMGVDIGSVNGVLMTNVPPSIANYRQRVGRAGRRGQPLSLAFTYSKDRPLDRETFKKPVEYLNKTILAPKIMLDSTSIVQRHINAFLFSNFIHFHHENALKLKAGAFFGCAIENKRVKKEERPIFVFITWIKQHEKDPSLQKSVARLVKATILAGRSDLFQQTIAALEDMEKVFVTEWSALQQQIIDTNDSKAKKAIEVQVKRLCDEFLLSELSDRGFLPGHGFPNHVVSLWLGKSNKTDLPEKFGERHGGPKRQLDIAIRDYAPGNEVVVDGLVYKVGGVSLNWQKPNSEKNIREVQSIRWAASCSSCGNAWTGGGNWPNSCPHCSDNNLKVERYLQPAGFKRDFQVQPHSEIEQVSFVPILSPRISVGNSPWDVLKNPQSGRFRVNHQGKVYYHSRGANNLGYGLCMHCGRMEPMTKDSSICEALIDHRPLTYSSSGALFCNGNDVPFAIQTNIELGYEVTTDVVEIQLAKLKDDLTAQAIAIAVREAMTQFLGIESGEIGFAISAAHNIFGSKTQSIFLFDKAVGGGGYVVRAADNLTTILRHARTILDCPDKCAHSCTSCILTNDSMNAEKIDRHPALEFMKNELDLSSEVAVIDQFTTQCEISDRPMAEMDKWLLDHGKSKINLWSCPSDIADFENWPVTPYLKAWALNEHDITIVLPNDFLASLDDAQLLYLRDFSSRNGVQFAEGLFHQCSNGSYIFAQLSNSKANQAWGCRDEEILTPQLDWSRVLTAPVITARFDPKIDYNIIDKKRLQPKPSALVISLDATLDGAIKDFGTKMGELIKRQVQKISGENCENIVSISYSDRFMRSPLTMKLLIDTLAILAPEDPLDLTIITASDKDSGFSRRNIASNIQDDQYLCDLAETYGQRHNINVTYKIAQPNHKRSMTITMPKQTVIIDLDQGFGWLNYDGTDIGFDSTVAVGQNAKKIAELNGDVKRRHNHDSQMVMWK